MDSFDTATETVNEEAEDRRCALREGLFWAPPYDLCRMTYDDTQSIIRFGYPGSSMHLSLHRLDAPIALLWCAVGLALAAAGCLYNAVQPRTAELVPGGGVGVNLNLDVYHYAPAEVTLADGRSGEANGALREHPTEELLILLPLLNSTFNLQIGLTDSVEIDPVISISQLGVDLRFAALSQRRGQAFALSPSVAALWRPWAQLEGYLVRAGLDASYRISATVPFLDVYLSYGSEEHALSLSELGTTCDPGDPDCEPSSLRMHVTRPEMRMNVAAGFEVQVGREESTVTGLTIAATLYRSLRNEDFSDVECVDCVSPPVDLQEPFGVGLSLALHFYSAER